MSNIHAAFSATRILLPTDFGPASEAALEAATGLALQFHAEIHLVHIIPEIPAIKLSDFIAETAVLQDRREIIEEKLDALKGQLMLKGVNASRSIETGNDIVGSLMRAIKRENADMLVISTHGLSGWRPLILGSIAEQVIKQVNCTLLLLQSGQHRPATEASAMEIPEQSFIPRWPRRTTSGRPLQSQRPFRRSASMGSHTSWLNEVAGPSNSTTKLTHSSQSRLS